MNGQVRQQWLDTLRTSSHKQSYGKLHPRKGYFCGLGILCNLYSRADGQRWQYDKRSHSYRLIGLESFPHKEVRTWAGLTAGQCGELARLNDTGSSFAAIADYIEANIPADE